MTAAMEKVTTNYLEGEQRICDSWANYIGSREMTLQEATDFVGASLAGEDICAHLLLTGRDSLEGLAITRQMVELMDGTIDCQSAPGEGTTFTVTLNLPIAERLVDEMLLSPINVLLADDDVLLETTMDTLSSIGVNADIARSGGEALEKALERHARGQDYRVVILDWKTPDMNGVEVARRIRSQVGDGISILECVSKIPEAHFRRL